MLAYDKKKNFMYKICCSKSLGWPWLKQTYFLDISIGVTRMFSFGFFLVIPLPFTQFKDPGEILRFHSIIYPSKNDFFSGKFLKFLFSEWRRRMCEICVVLLSHFTGHNISAHEDSIPISINIVWKQVIKRHENSNGMDNRRVWIAYRIQPD